MTTATYPPKPARRPSVERVEGASAEYRTFTITRAWMGSGHVNVSIGDGFVGGFKTVAAACEHIDSAIRQATAIVHRLTPDECEAKGLSRDACAYSVTYPEDDA